jgi:hypothetical protein
MTLKYGLWLPPSGLKPLISKQKAAIRIIAGRKYNDHTIFKKLSILPFPDLITTSNLKFFHSYVFSYLPTAFDNTWITVGQSHEDNLNLELRNDAKYYIPRHRTDQIARLPLFNLPRLWSLHTWAKWLSL